MYLEPFYALLHSSLKHSFKCDFCPPTHHFTSCVIKIQVHPMQMSYSFRHVYEGCKIRLAKYQSLFFSAQQRILTMSQYTCTFNEI